MLAIESIITTVVPSAYVVKANTKEEEEEDRREDCRKARSGKVESPQ